MLEINKLLHYHFQSVCLHAEEAVYTLRDVFSERVSRDFKMEVAQCLGTVVYIFTNENRRSGEPLLNALILKLCST